jgi:hypothetical protein
VTWCATLLFWWYVDVPLAPGNGSRTSGQYLTVSTGQRLSAASQDADLFECYVLSKKTILDTAQAKAST